MDSTATTDTVDQRLQVLASAWRVGYRDGVADEQRRVAPGPDPKFRRTSNPYEPRVTA